jgi:hypothetical protein
MGMGMGMGMGLGMGMGVRTETLKVVIGQILCVLVGGAVAYRDSW